jgi:hypothetical protein
MRSATCTAYLASGPETNHYHDTPPSKGFWQPARCRCHWGFGGGVAALPALAKTLPADFSGLIFIVLHLGVNLPCILPSC